MNYLGFTLQEEQFMQRVNMACDALFNEHGSIPSLEDVSECVGANSVLVSPFFIEWMRKKRLSQSSCPMCDGFHLVEIAPAYFMLCGCSLGLV